MTKPHAPGNPGPGETGPGGDRLSADQQADALLADGLSGATQEGYSRRSRFDVTKDKKPHTGGGNPTSRRNLLKKGGWTALGIVGLVVTAKVGSDALDGSEGPSGPPQALETEPELTEPPVEIGNISQELLDSLPDAFTEEMDGIPVRVPYPVMPNEAAGITPHMSLVAAVNALLTMTWVSDARYRALKEELLITDKSRTLVSDLTDHFRGGYIGGWTGSLPIAYDDKDNPSAATFGPRYLNSYFGTQDIVTETNDNSVLYKFVPADVIRAHRGEDLAEIAANYAEYPPFNFRNLSFWLVPDPAHPGRAKIMAFSFKAIAAGSTVLSTYTY